MGGLYPGRDTIPVTMPLLCGIDPGSFNTLGYVAWLEDQHFLLDIYKPTRERPLPNPPAGEPPIFTGIDAPQGLPRQGEPRRLADALADTPVRVLPGDRNALRDWKLYRGLIEVGVDVFWSIYEHDLASIFGLVLMPELESIVFETYPRYVFRQLWPGVRLPSKRNEPFAYVETVWRLIQSDGYLCESVLRPAVDHVDAMLCALAAEACLHADGLPAGTVGLPPVVDRDERVLREGFIVAPGRRV
jgi:hypothetical protein